MLLLSDLITISCISACTALAGLAFLFVGRERRSVYPVTAKEPLSLLFDRDVLHHATQSALTQFTLYPGESHWNDLRANLSARFPDLPECAGTTDEGNLSMRAVEDGAPARLDMKWRGPLCWITLTEDEPEQSIIADPVPLDELEALNQSCRTSPNAIWHVASDGRVIWANRAYKKLNAEFSKAGQDTLFPLPQGCEPHRVSLQKSAPESIDWFEVTSSIHGQIKICHANNINALVQAEIAQRNFVQTLAKTFAHLSIGLAIFDRNAQLALFNPALVDLTGLPAPFLSARPNMLSFFDQLRENRQMPEPKNYLTWRQEIAEVIAAAHDGKYQETWSLENGRTYSVLGRPHPDGATAFMIEDISSEVALTRTFRAELELGQSLLDMVNEGVVAFSSAGILTFCNATYRDLWGQNPEAAFADTTIHDCIRLWREKTHGTAAWDVIETAVMDVENKDGLEIPIAMKSGPSMICEIHRMMPDTVALKFRVVNGTASRNKQLEKS